MIMSVMYTRVGWQDAPSTDTPIDAANLNHMDNGILALSEEVDTELPLLQERVEAVETASFIKAYYGSIGVEPTPGSTFKSVVAPFPIDNYDHIVALIPLGGFVEEELLVAADEEETGTTSAEVSGVVIEGVNEHTNAIWCRFIGPVAETYTVKYLFLYY